MEGGRKNETGWQLEERHSWRAHQTLMLCLETGYRYGSVSVPQVFCGDVHTLMYV